MDADLQKKLAGCRDLPSPPGVASQIITLANDPESGMDQIARVLATDPALTSKILRIANSPMYALSRKTENLRQALIVLGVNATISLALSFSLLRSWQGERAQTGLDYALFWRRSLLAATASQVLAKAVGLKDTEEVFLACLLQDIGMMALDRVLPELYADAGADQKRHAAICRHEVERLGTDHADVGGWLLERWHFPERIQQAVAASHAPESVPPDAPHGPFVRCIAVAARVAEVFTDEHTDREFKALAAAAESHLGLPKPRLVDLLGEIAAVVPDAEAVFQTNLLGREADTILQEAREALVMRSILAMQVVESLRGQADTLERRTKALEESTRRDPLTGLYNRTYLIDYLADAFRTANSTQAPLTVAFADLDRFKQINDKYGHAAGDQVLVAAANILKGNVRATDVVARCGGEEFVLVFPGTDYAAGSTICDRIVKALQEARHDVGAKRHLAVTVSIGIATHNDGRRFTESEELLRAADKAMYEAKHRGRNRTVPFELIA